MTHSGSITRVYLRIKHHSQKNNYAPGNDKVMTKLQVLLRHVGQRTGNMDTDID